MKKYLLQIDLSAEQEGVVSFSFATSEIIAAQARLAALRGMRYYVYDISSLGVVEPICCVTDFESGVFNIIGRRMDGAVEFKHSIANGDPDLKEAV